MAVISGRPESALSLCELVSGMCEPSRLSLGRKMEKAIPEDETGRVCRAISMATARSQGSQRRGKSLKWPPLSTCGAETVSGADWVVGPAAPTFSQLIRIFQRDRSV